MKIAFLVSQIPLVFLLLTQSFNALASGDQAQTSKPPQFVLLAFDGSKNVEFWKASRKFAAENNVKLTYFVSGVHFLSDKESKSYIEPKFGAGQSSIGFGGQPASIVERLNQIKLAMSEGHEIGSHANGHFSGATYSQSQWESEFTQFTDIMANAWRRYDPANEPSGWSEFFINEISGFRAPLLGVSKGLWPVLKSKGFAYDTSRMGSKTYWPEKLNGVWNFPLARIKLASTTQQTLSMDYNFFMAQSRAFTGPPSEFKRYEDQMFQSYMDYFKGNYNGNRAPIHIGHHFTLWNGGAYWKAMKRFAEAVCRQPEVKCATYAELAKYLESQL